MTDLRNGIINTDDLFCDVYKAVVLCEYTEELSLIKQLIEIGESCIEESGPEKLWSFEHVCYMFAKSIMDYSKTVYDNFLLGHFKAVLMILRVIVENLVCLDIIIHDEAKELWKYYLVYSFKKTMLTAKKKLSVNEMETLEAIYSEYNIDSKFYTAKEKETAFIDRNYGWTYKINNKFSFSGLCKLVEKNDYSDFKMLSEFSHGTSVYSKLDDSTSCERIMNMISCLYSAISRMLRMYCLDLLEEDFYEVKEELDDRMLRFFEECATISKLLT